MEKQTSVSVPFLSQLTQLSQNIVITEIGKLHNICHVQTCKCALVHIRTFHFLSALPPPHFPSFSYGGQIPAA